MATAAPILSNSGGGLDSLIKLMQVMGPNLGSGKTTSSGSEKSSISPDTNDQANALLQQIMGSANGGDIDNMVKGILDQAKNAFGPAAIESNFAGVRGYSDTTLAMLRDNAMAKATSQAAQAKLEAINNANKTAVSLVDSKMANTRSVQTAKTSATGTSTLGKVASAAGIAASLNSLMKSSKKSTDKSAGNEDGMPEQVGGPTGDEFANDGANGLNDQAFAAPANNGINTAQLNAGQDPNILLAQAGGTTSDTSAALAGDPSGVASMTPAEANAVAAATNGGISAQDAVTIGPIGTQKAIEAQDAAMADPEAVDVVPSDLSNTISTDSLIGGGSSDTIAATSTSESVAAGAGGATALDAFPGFAIIDAISGGELSGGAMAAGNDFASNADDFTGSIGEAGDVATNAPENIFNSIFGDLF